MEREGDRSVWAPRAWAEATPVGLWLWVLNRLVFHRTLDWRDFGWILVLALASSHLGRVLCRPIKHPAKPILADLAGQIVLVVGVFLLGAAHGWHLSPRQGLKFIGWEVPLFIFVRMVDRQCRRAHPETAWETSRLVLVVAAGLALAEVFVTDGRVGSGDAYWYETMLSDFIAQWRAGVFPVFIGQSELAFNGAVSPLRFAPYFQHFAGVLDLLTFRALGFSALQNLTLVLAVVGGGLSAYLSSAAILPRRRWIALGAAVLYLSCPTVLALLYTGNLFMSVMTLPYLPLAAYGLWHWWEKGESGGVFRSAAWLALPLAALWWCHPPIALWTTGVVSLLAVARLVSAWRDRRAWLAAALAAGLFAVTAGYVFASVLTLETPPTPPVNPVSFLGSIEGAFPASVLPVSVDAVQISDYQLGWSLWIVAGFAFVAAVRTPRRGLGVLAGGTAILILFLMPVPGIDRWLWVHAVPQFVSDVTFAWAAQRLCVVLAVFAAIAGVAAVSVVPAASLLRRILVLAFFGAAIAWNATEAVKFLRRGTAMAVPAEIAAKTEGVHNAFLTRYAFNVLLPVPAYFSHGYVDPYLENRILDPKGRTVLASNIASVRPADTDTSIPLTAAYNPSLHLADISPVFSIAPGYRYAVRLDWHAPVGSGALTAEGEHTERQYFLPDSSYGMIHQVPTHAFGYSPGNSDFFPLSASGEQREWIKLAYAYYDPAPASLPVDFGRLYLRPYTEETLPIVVTSWMPYQAKASAPAAGDWLETPRLFVPGYAATVNSRAARLRRSPDGLVAIELQAGENQVLLRYPAPWLLRAAYAVSLLAWVMLLSGWAAGAVLRSRFRLRASPAR
jgi:hypothetical protein